MSSAAVNSSLLNQIQYAPLENNDEIRVLEIIKDGSTDGSVECVLHHVSITHDHQFAALSYVWGVSTCTEEILVNGCRKAVTKNLASALRWVKYHWHQRFPDRDLAHFRLWADAVCINQDDTSERNHQVGMMKDIYSQAELVMASVSVADPKTRLAFQTYDEVYQALTTTDPAVLLKEVSNREWLKRIPRLYSESPDTTEHPRNESWQAIRHFSFLPYWERVWILQETALAKELLLICDDVSINFDRVASISETLQSSTDESAVGTEVKMRSKPFWMPDSVWCYHCYQSFIDIGASRWGRAVQLRRYIKQRMFPVFDHVVHLAKHYTATDPKDRVYGMLGLATVDLDVDYTKSADEVYFDFVQAYLQTIAFDECYNIRPMSCRFLDYTGVRATKHQNLPSWVPDFSVQYTTEYGSIQCPDQLRFLDESSWLEYWPEAENRSLHIYGARLCQVRKTGKLRPSNNESIFDFIFERDVLELVRDLIMRGAVILDGIPPLQALFRVLTTSQGSPSLESAVRALVFFLEWIFEGTFGHDFETLADIISPVVHLPFGSDFEKTGRSTVQWFVENVFPDREDITADILGDLYHWWAPNHNPSRNSALGSDLTVTPGNVVFETDDGSLGCASEGVAAGDIVCVFLNDVDMPIVLREVDDHFVCLGSCFVLGIHGDVPTELYEEGKIQLERFELR